MQRATLLAMMMAVAATLGAQPDRSATGKWDLHADVQGTKLTLVCAIEEKDGKLSGTCTGGGDDDTVARPIHGEVTEKELNWRFDARYEAKPVSVSMRAVLDAAGTKMYGTMSVEPIDADGTFLAEKQTADATAPAQP